MWPDRRIIDLFGIEHPILLAPMAGPGHGGAGDRRGGGRRPRRAPLRRCSSPEQIRTDLGVIRQRTAKPINLNFFTHTPPQPDPAREARWKARLAPLLRGSSASIPTSRCPPSTARPSTRRPARIVEEFKPEIVSFHFGLPEPRAAGARAGRRLQGDRVGDHGGRGDVAGRARLRCDHRAGCGGRRPPRHVPHRRRRLPGRHLRAGAAGGRRRQGARDRRRRHRRCARHRGRPGPRRRGGADRHRLSLLPGGQRPGVAPAGAAQRPRRRHRAHQPVLPAAPPAASSTA